MTGHLASDPSAHTDLLVHGAVLALLRAVDSDLDGGIEEAIVRAPFLGNWVGQLAEILPPGIGWDGACTWWFEHLDAWEQEHAPDLPLLGVSALATLADRLVWSLIGLVDEDIAFAAVTSELQAGLSGQGLLPQTVRTAFEPLPIDALASIRRLTSAGVVQRQSGELRVDPRLWELTRNPTLTAAWRDELSSGRATQRDMGAHDPIAHWDHERRSALTRHFAALLDGSINTMIVRAVPGSDPQPAIAALAAERASTIICWTSPEEFAAGPTLAAAELVGAVPALVLDPAPGESIQVTRAPGYDGPLIICTGGAGGVTPTPNERRTIVDLGRGDRAERHRFWTTNGVGGGRAAIDKATDAFILPDGHLRQLANDGLVRAQLDGRRKARVGDLRAAAVELSEHHLETRATRIDGSLSSWNDLVVPASVADALKVLMQHCTFREQLAQHESQPGAQGVRALFLGPSGTGKTLAAQVVAAELGRLIFRVDLASIFDKWVGETEKNLEQLLSVAEQLDVVLLMDEGDTLLGNRTSVQSANDRYANLETNFLLQRIEDYSGIVIVTSNASDRIDSAFARRMDATVTFPKPAAAERRQIWDLHLDDALVGAAGLDEVATHRLTGGQIRNASRQARLLSLRNGRSIALEDVRAAIAAEYRSAGALVPVDAAGEETPEGRAAAFVARLTGV